MEGVDGGMASDDRRRCAECRAPVAPIMPGLPAADGSAGARLLAAKKQKHH
jgi:hypothetical protein